MQIIHLQYKDDDSTYMLNNQLTGILVAGVYRGYKLSGAKDRTLQLEGDAYEVSQEGLEESKVSVLRTPQGCIVKETDIVEVTLAENTGSYDRVDLIYCEHNYTEVEGGTEAVYKVKSGTSGMIPTISNRKTQVPIALVTVPSGWTGGAGTLVYKRFATPDLAEDGTIPHTDRKNTFESEQTFRNTKKEFAECEVVESVMRSDKKGYDLYKFGSEDSQDFVQVQSLDLGSSHGKLVDILIITPCIFLFREIYNPTESPLAVGKGSLVRMLDVSNSPINGKKWLIVSSSALEKNAYGDYVIEGNLNISEKLLAKDAEISNKLHAKVALFDGRVTKTLSITSESITLAFAEFDLLVCSVQTSETLSMYVSDKDTLQAGKEIKIANTGSQSIWLIGLGRYGQNIVIAPKSVVSLMKADTSYFLVLAEHNIPSSE